ncbi:MAG: hypothetical protein HZA13_02435 [Nitrospirae bacterium]|nr:hypothetical protein [Nitrospirota bacterium]
MKKIFAFLYVIGLLFINFYLCVGSDVFAAHILEPLGTEIAATPPRGRIFGQVRYEFSREENGALKDIHLLPVELEIGIGERTQLNLEGGILLREKETGYPKDSGVEEIGFGIKHRFLDETRILPDAAFGAEFSPSTGVNGNGHGMKGTVIFSKNLHPGFVIHFNGAYELETEREFDGATGTEEVVNHTIWSYSVAPMIKVIPDRLMVLAELNGQSPAFGDTELTLAPEVIGVIQTETFFTLQNLAFKLAVPFGLNEHSPDIGVKFGISKLF